MVINLQVSLGDKKSIEETMRRIIVPILLLVVTLAKRSKHKSAFKIESLKLMIQQPNLFTPAGGWK